MLSNSSCCFVDPNIADEVIDGIGAANGFIVERIIKGWPEFREIANKAKIKSVR